MSYTKKILEVNLTDRKITLRTLDDVFLKKYIGGRGLAVRLAFDYIPEKADPLSPENAVMLITGPLTGTAAPSMRMTMATKSPASNTFSASYVGGHVAAEIKYAGYDGVVILGRASEPSILEIENEKVTIKAAGDLWGKDTFETESALRKEDPRKRVLCIGPAGENLVRYALVNTEYYRHAGRGGTGTVFGSKNLKAVTVRGTLAVPLADADSFMELANNAWQVLMSEKLDRYHNYGTLSSVTTSSANSTFPYKNFKEETYPKADKISVRYAEKNIYEASRGCYLCPIHCGHLSIVKEGKRKGAIVEGPEYETAALLGGNCDVDRLEEITYFNMLCDKLGMDSISTGAVLSFVMECCEKGIITEADAGGKLLSWGDTDGMEQMIKRIAYREGIGDLMAEGVKRASEKIGQGSETFAMHVKGLEMAGWTARSASGMALCYATADRGADHQQANTCGYETAGVQGPDGEPLKRNSPKGKAYFVKKDQDYIAAFSCLVSCEFSVSWVGLNNLVRMYRYATGLDLTEEDLIEAGERSFNLSRLFNAREGVTRVQDCLPKRITEEKLSIGIAAGSTVSQEDLSYMLQDYYRIRGWDPESGLPTLETLKRLGIEEPGKD